MRFVFIDEIEQPKKKSGLFGVSSLVLNSNHYSTLKESVDSALDAAKWNRGAEFKGRYIFSKSGDENVSVENRIELVRSIVSATTAKKNARARFCFAHNEKGRTTENYVDLVKRVIAKCPHPENQTQDKPLVSVYCDSLNEVKPEDIEKAILPVLEDRRLRLVETPVMLKSTNSTAGLIAADVLAYLASWDVLSPHPNEAQQAALFETEVAKLNAQKLATIREILELVKQVEVINA